MVKENGILFTLQGLPQLVGFLFKSRQAQMEENIHRIPLNEKEIILVGTAHVSRDSADLVERVISEERPDTVCIELCRSRYEAVTRKEEWEKTDLFRVIREKRSAQLLAQLLMASFQKKLADRFGIRPGEEMLRAMAQAEAVGAEIVLADRDIRTTMMRTWRKMRFTSRLRLMAEIPLSLFLSDDITEEDVEKLKEQDALEAALQTFGKKLPEVRETLIGERDRFMAHAISHAPGRKIVAVVGAGHVPGILRHLAESENTDLAELTRIPPPGSIGRVIQWLVPLGVLALIIAGFLKSGAAAGLGMVKWWIVANGVLAALGALLVFAHPVTVAASFAAAPLTSLNPMIAAGWVAGLVEASLRKPRVADFVHLREDISSLRGFWRNKITRILLLVIFVNLGSVVGTFAALPLMVRYLNG
ncbi:MAG TPA: TraB/GumN family protein [Syntrophales bacterium]|nr:TraB/GumN family protein [Syntrophales bacterium]